MFQKKITCPFCFETFSPKMVKYRCINPNCKKEADPIYAEHRNLNIPPTLEHVFQPVRQRNILKKQTMAVPCPECSRETSKRLCYNCHFELSSTAGILDDYTIAIIGGPDTGKGHYIATLIHRLEQDVGANFSFGLRMEGEDTRERFDLFYRIPLFDRKELLQPTRSASVDVSVKYPMVFRLTFHSRALNISFFDTAGEDMIDLDTMSSEARYIGTADGIIFLLDPLQIDAIRQLISNPDILPARDIRANPSYIVERVRELYERQQGLSPHEKIKTPVAFTLSKIDALLPIIDRSSVLHYTGPHFGYFDISDGESIDTEIWNYIKTWMGDGFINRVTAAFSNFKYFGVSSLGHTPVISGPLETISPVRVEDPFLWILSKLKLIRAK